MKYIDPQNKILYFPSHLARWLAGEIIYPIVVELDLSNACNLKCSFCYSIRDQPVLDGTLMDFQLAQKVQGDLKEVGVKALTYSGGGEPTLNPDLGKILANGYDLGFDQGLYTNGVLLDRWLVPIERFLKFVHISLNAPDRETFKEQTGVDAFHRIVRNIKQLLEFKRSVIVAIGMIVTEQNMGEDGGNIRKFYDLGKNLGVDLCGFKPDWAESRRGLLQRMWDVVSQLPDEGVSKSEYRFMDQMKEDPRSYKRCFGHNFIGCVGADGTVWLCTGFRGNRGFELGNLKEESFRDIWNSEKRREVISRIDLSKCLRACRPHVLNKFLDWILEGNPHAAFL